MTCHVSHRQTRFESVGLDGRASMLLDVGEMDEEIKLLGVGCPILVGRFRF